MVLTAAYSCTDHVALKQVQSHSHHMRFFAHFVSFVLKQEEVLKYDVNKVFLLENKHLFGFSHNFVSKQDTALKPNSSYYLWVMHAVCVCVCVCECVSVHMPAWHGGAGCRPYLGVTGENPAD